MSDDHIYQAINANSNKLIPTHNIDRIARQGVLFQNYFVTNSICGPSRAIILTGKHSHINQLELESLPKKVNEILGLLMMAIIGGAIIPPLMGGNCRSIKLHNEFVFIIWLWYYNNNDWINE